MTIKEMGKTEKLKREKQREKETRLDRDRRLLETNLETNEERE
jgi:hypothetical protein